MAEEVDVPRDYFESREALKWTLRDVVGYDSERLASAIMARLVSEACPYGMWYLERMERLEGQ